MRLSNFFIESIGLYLPESYSTESALANETLSAAAPHDPRSSRETSPAFTVCSPKRSPRPSTLSMPPWRLSRTKPRSGEIAVAGYCARHTYRATTISTVERNICPCGRGFARTSRKGR